jgi:hypothetical protein
MPLIGAPDTRGQYERLAIAYEQLADKLERLKPPADPMQRLNGE